MHLKKSRRILRITNLLLNREKSWSVAIISSKQPYIHQHARTRSIRRCRAYRIDDDVLSSRWIRFLFRDAHDSVSTRVLMSSSATETKTTSVTNARVQLRNRFYGNESTSMVTVRVPSQRGGRVFKNINVRAHMSIPLIVVLVTTRNIRCGYML